MDIGFNSSKKLITRQWQADGHYGGRALEACEFARRFWTLLLVGRWWRDPVTGSLRHTARWQASVGVTDVRSCRSSKSKASVPRRACHQGLLFFVSNTRWFDGCLCQLCHRHRHRRLHHRHLDHHRTSIEQRVNDGAGALARKGGGSGCAAHCFGMLGRETSAPVLRSPAAGFHDGSLRSFHRT